MLSEIVVIGMLIVNILVFTSFKLGLFKIKSYKLALAIYRLNLLLTAILFVPMISIFFNYFDVPNKDFPLTSKIILSVGAFFSVSLSMYNTTICKYCRKIAHSKKLWSVPKHCPHCNKTL
ncbi:membrane hypothetical protein [Vibrio crassostreae]|nr:membrane hypothetical protein [Vibrio crassostreae]CAK3831896.1 membrane hypothetical protein [Vibrio crassostreae]